MAKPGDVNWMTAGSGILHSEGPGGDMIKNGGTVQLLQLWINLPAEKKQMDAVFSHYAVDTLPVIEKENYRIKVIIGGFDEQLSPATTHTRCFYTTSTLVKDNR